MAKYSFLGVHSPPLAEPLNTRNLRLAPRGAVGEDKSLKVTELIVPAVVEGSLESD